MFYKWFRSNRKMKLQNKGNRIRVDSECIPSVKADLQIKHNQFGGDSTQWIISNETIVNYNRLRTFLTFYNFLKFEKKAYLPVYHFIVFNHVSAITMHINVWFGILFLPLMWVKTYFLLYVNRTHDLRTNCLTHRSGMFYHYTNSLHL